MDFSQFGSSNSFSAKTISDFTDMYQIYSHHNYSFFLLTLFCAFSHSPDFSLPPLFLTKQHSRGS